MTKSELIAVVAARTERNKTQAEKAVNAVIDAISNTLAGGEDVAITGFGTFTAKSRPAREGRNPRTGATLQIAAAKTSVSFKPGKALKDALN